MIFDYETIKFIWWVFVAVLLIGFALTDGYDMGAGTLLPFIGRSDEQRRVILNALAPHWDGNQVWFITGAAALFAAWPPVYAAAFSGFYLVLLGTLFSLLLRPGAFEYRSKVEDPRWRGAWDWALFVGSAFPALIFGAAFGNLLLGVPFTYDADLRPIYEGTVLGQLRPFALLTGLVGLSLLVTHGAVYLGLRTEGDVRHRADGAARLFAVIMVLAFLLAGIWLALGIPGYHIVSMPSPEAASNLLAKRVEPMAGAWLANYRAYPWTLLAPIGGVVGAIGVLVFAGRGNGRLAFAASTVSVVGVIATAGISLFPFIMPSSINPNASLTVWDSTSSYRTLSIMFWVTVIFLPVVLGYTFWAYRIMWRRLDVDHIREEGSNLY